MTNDVLSTFPERTLEKTENCDSHNSAVFIVLIAILTVLCTIAMKIADLKAWMPSAWRICLCPLGMTPLIPMVADEHIKHRAIWFLLAMGGFLWAMVWAQEDGAKRKEAHHG